MSTYKVYINWTNKTTRKVSKVFGAIALIGFAIWYIVDLPVRQAPSEISILYYFDFLPKWMLSMFGGTAIFGALAILLFGIRRNAIGTLNLEPNKISIESRKRCDIILFKDLLRINLIVSPLKLRAYRMEFLYLDDSYKRVKLRSKKDFYRLIDEIHQIAPFGFTIEVFSSEYVNYDE